MVDNSNKIKYLEKIWLKTMACHFPQNYYIVAFFIKFDATNLIIWPIFLAKMYDKLFMYYHIGQKLQLTCNFWVYTPCLSLLETFWLFFYVTKYYFFSKFLIIGLALLTFALLTVDWTQPDSCVSPSPQGASPSPSPQESVRVHRAWVRVHGAWVQVRTQTRPLSQSLDSLQHW